MSAATVASAPPAGAPPRFVECRVYEREACELQTSCQPLAARSSQDIRWRAAIRDISEGGVGLVLVRRFERGTVLAVQLPPSEDPPPPPLLPHLPPFPPPPPAPL